MASGRVSRAHSYVTGSGLGPLLVRSVAGSGAVKMAAMAASFGVGVQLAHLLGVEGYGYYGLALSVITVAGIPAELGLSKLVTREVAAAVVRNDDGQLFGALRWARRAALIFSVAMAALVFGASLIVGFREPSLIVLAIMAGAPTIPLMALARIDGGALQGLNHVVLGQIPANVLRPLCLSLALAACYFASVPVSPASAMFLNSVTALVAFVLSYIWLRRRLPRSRPPAFVRTGRAWLKTSIPMAMTDGMQMLQTELSLILLGITAGATITGLFRIATVTVATAGAAGVVIAQVALPVIARLHAEDDPVRLQKVVSVLAWAQFAGVSVLMLPLLIMPVQLLSFAFGSEYGPAADAVRILAAAQVVNAAFGPNAVLLNMTGHERRVTRAVMFALLFNLALLPPLAAWLGAAGAAFAVLPSLLIWNVITWRDAQRLLGIETSAFLRLGTML